jgi:DNA-binding HxlR family transcriptional regulator
MTTCPVFQTAKVIGKKWTIPLLQEIDLHGKKGFTTLLKQMKTITPKILTQQLKLFEEQDLIFKEKNNKKSTSYTLTTKGKEFYTIITSLQLWHQEQNEVPPSCSHRRCTECEHYYEKSSH